MKYIIVGLGNFGASLAQKLTEQGNEVIGVDNNMSKVDAFKSKVSHTICLDSTDQHTVSGLPLKDTDIVIVAIGEDQGANIMTTAVLKNLNAKRLISRAINPLHETILQAMGVDEIVHPEEETAERWAKKLCMKGVVDSFELSDDFSIVEVAVPESFEGKTIEEVSIRQRFNLLVLTTIEIQEGKSILGVRKKIQKVQKVATPDTVLQKDHLMVVYGNNRDIRKLISV
ncbi:MAG: TrkA family potassium uptake protein [Bacteroidia bacterium]